MSRAMSPGSGTEAGLYPIGCPACGQLHLWFSGNADQRCLGCRDNNNVPAPPQPAAPEPSCPPL
jgi:hypothetical protein